MVGEVRKRKRVLWILTAGAVMGVLLGAHFTRQRSLAQENALLQRRIEGAWELSTLKGEPVEEAIDSHRMTLHEGQVHGVTILRVGTVAATSAMPFPDASVRGVTISPDGMQLIVSWDGEYELKEGRFLELTIGTAKYRARLKFDARTPSLELDHDTILVYPGVAVYQPATSLVAAIPSTLLR